MSDTTYLLPPQSAPPRRSISDLRAQIFANAGFIKPDLDLELIVAKVIKAPDGARMRFRQAYLNALTAAYDEHEPAAVSSSTQPGKYYAVLFQRRTHRTDMMIIRQSATRDTAEEAMEDMLERTERVIHTMLVAKDYKQARDDTCCVM